MGSSDYSMGHKNDMKLVTESLRRDRCSMEGELERVVEKLQQSEWKCVELAERVTRLLEEKKVSNDRQKRVEEWCDKVLTENSEIVIQKNNHILELMEKVYETKEMTLEYECLVRLYKEKYKCLDLKIVKMNQEIEDLKHERLTAVKMIEELKRENIEANKTIYELRIKKSESDKLVEEYRTELQILWARINKSGEDLVETMTAKVRDVVNLFNDVRKLKAFEEGTSLEILVSKGNNLNDSTPGAHASGTSELMSGPGHFNKTTSSSLAARDIIDILNNDDESKPDVAVDVLNMGEKSIHKRKRNNISASGEEAKP